MTRTRKKLYLDALGIDTWSARAARETATCSLRESEPEVSNSNSRSVISPKTDAPHQEFKNISMPIEAPNVESVPRNWEQLKAAVSGCTRCRLCSTRTKTVFGVGLEHAPLLVIGEGPGADEDASGEPFVGRAGRLLDEMLRSIGRSRGESTATRAVFIANVVKCRPPGNRDPHPEEVEACRPYLDEQIRHIKPKLIVALGKIAAQRLLETDLPLSKLRGALQVYGDDSIPVLVSYHPAYLLRSPGEKAKSWMDLKQVHRVLAG